MEGRLYDTAMFAPPMAALAVPGGESIERGGSAGWVGWGSLTGGVAAAGVAVGGGTSVARGD